MTAENDNILITIWNSLSRKSKFHPPKVFGKCEKQGTTKAININTKHLLNRSLNKIMFILFKY